MFNWILQGNNNTYSFNYGLLSQIFGNTANYNTVNPFCGSLFSFRPTTYDFNFNKFSYIPVTGNYNKTFLNGTKQKASNSSAAKVNTTNQNMSFWERLGYNAKAGINLAQKALNNAVGFTGYCARYVKNAIVKSGLGKYESGNACDMTQILARNKNFKKISPNGVDLNSLPAGCILVYDHGVSGADRTYGHTEITDGNGRGISDGIRKIRKPSAIFVPVSA